MSKRTHPRLAQLKITAFSKEGLGNGVWQPENGQPQQVLVPFSMPEDEVQVRLLKKRGGVYQSQPLEWLQLSEKRVAPRCRHFGHCGGCRWQHVAYEDQLKIKESWIHRYLDPFIHSDTISHSILPCLPPWQYRNKMELTFSNDKAGQRYLGLILYGTRGHVFQMEECHLMNPWIIDAVKATSQWWIQSGLDAYYSGGDKGSLRTLTLREGYHTGDRMVMLTVSGNPEYALNQKQIHSFVAALRQAIEPSLPDQKLSIFLRIQQIAKGQKTQFYEMLLHGPDHIRETLHIETAQNERHSLHFRISPSAFFQPNTRQAEQLYSRALQLTQAPTGGIIYDLYCGTGTLGICMAKQAKEVIGIEISPESALDARENVKANHLSNVSIRTGDVGHILPLLLQENQSHLDLVMVDPPRSGLDSRALNHLLALKAPRVTYISCNPATQAANLEVLVKGGYRLRAVQPIDQFPQTVHVENIAVLTL
jgi:23S rRNA (uracil1939-C5)-methyltransferase